MHAPQSSPGVQGHSPIYGTECQTGGGPFQAILQQHNVPCAVCYVSTRESQTALMLPARMECPTSWTLEYSGYLMSAYINVSVGAIIIAQCSNVWTPTLTLFLEVLLTRMVFCCTTQRLPAMVYHVDLMTHRKNSPVLSALNGSPSSDVAELYNEHNT